MSITNLRHPLEKRYSGLTGELEHVRHRIERIKRDIDQLAELEASVPELERRIANLRNTLLDEYPDWDPDATPAIKPWTHHIPVPFGQCGRRGMAVLRESDRPLSCRQVAEEVLRRCGVAEPDLESLRRVQCAIESSFRKFEGRTVESSGRYPKQWRAINKPEIDFDP